MPGEFEVGPDTRYLRTDMKLVNKEKLPCGCVIGQTVENGVNVFAIKPCSETCTYYAFVVEEARKKQKPIETREGYVE